MTPTRQNPLNWGVQKAGEMLSSERVLAALPEVWFPGPTLGSSQPPGTPALGDLTPPLAL